MTKRILTKQRNGDDIFIGLAILVSGVIFQSWWGILGLLPAVLRIIDLIHGLFTYRELHY